MSFSKFLRNLVIGPSEWEIKQRNEEELAKCELERIKDGRPSINDMLSGSSQDMSKRTGNCKYCSYEMCYHPLTNRLSEAYGVPMMRRSCDGNSRPSVCPISIYEEWEKDPKYPPEYEFYCETCVYHESPRLQCATVEPTFGCKITKDTNLKYTFMIYWKDIDHPIVFNHIVPVCEQMVCLNEVQS